MDRQRQVSGIGAGMTTLAMALGCAAALSDLRIVAANISVIRNGLQFSPGTTIFVSSLATLTMAASVLGAGVLADRYGMRRMFLAGAWGAVVFGLIGAAAPGVGLLMVARSGIGVAFAFLSGLSLAIMNAVFPPERRAGAIAGYLAAVYALGTFPPAVGSLLAERIGWRSGLLVTPLLAILVVAITLRFVPETQRSHRRIDVTGLVLIAVGLIGITYGITRLQNGVDLWATGAILTGILAGAGFIWWELRCDHPALDMRIFGSHRFNAVVIAGAANNLVQGGSMMMVTFYLVVIRDESTWAFALLLIPATLVSALAAWWSGRAAVRLGNCTVVVAGLLVLGASLLMRVTFGATTPIAVVAAVVALTTVGGAIVQTPQTTVMMASAPVNLGGVVSAVKASVAGTFYGLGAAIFSMSGILLFIRDAEQRLRGSGIGAVEAGNILASPAPVPAVMAPERTAWVVSQATSSMLDAAHVLNLVMTAIPLTAAVIVVVLFRRGHLPDRSTPGA